MTPRNNTIFLECIENAFQKNDFLKLRSLREHFSLQVIDIHNKRIKSGGPFSPDSKALVEELDELLQTIDEKIRALV